MSEYSSKVRDHFIAPKHLGSITDADGVGEVGNKLCGDTVKMHVKLSDGTVSTVKWQSFGCVYSVACADELADMIEGKTVSQAEAVQPDDVVKELGGVPDSKRHCSVMAVNAFRAALKNAGHNVELLSGSRELVASNASLLIPISVQKKHLIAELFDEFIISEMKSKGIEVELVSVDVDSFKIEAKASSSKDFSKAFIEKILKDHVDQRVTVYIA